MPPEQILPQDLIPMDLFSGSEPITIDLVYADKNHPENIFKEEIYHAQARLFLHRDLARIVILAARSIHYQRKHILVLKDGLRTTEAEECAINTNIIRQNPQWLEGPFVLFSKPGTGGHPRGMAVDVSLNDENGDPVDMGTCFDTMTVQSARNYDGFTKDILASRKNLEDSFVKAAQKLMLPMLPLPSEWWDFRFPRNYYEQWDPLSDANLPDPFKMCVASSIHTGEWQERFDKSAKDVLNSL